MLENLCQEPAADAQAQGAAKQVHRIDPLKDPRWGELLARHPAASLFHTTAWLEALRRTYGYGSIAYTTSAPGEPLENGIPFCRIDSWLTGRRLVSLPFSDHCAPLVRSEEDLRILVSALQEELVRERWRYVEMRPHQSLEMQNFLPDPVVTYTLHRLDLRPGLDTLFGQFHKNSVQRKIRRAEREGLAYQEGSSESIVDTFYRLLVMTRRRHKVPPQPREWFRNLADCFGEALKIRIALKAGRPVAAMLTIRHRETLVYKYGGSDARFNNLGGMHLLYWKSIQDAKESGLQVFDLGRSDADQVGLITFKSRWGAAQSRLAYFRLTANGNGVHIFDPAVSSWQMRTAKQIFSCAPARVLSALGTILYKHIG